MHIGFLERLRVVTHRLGCVSLLFLVLTTSACTQFLFQPLRPHFNSPAVVKLQFDDIYAVNPQGLRLHGWKLHAVGNYLGSVIFFHGNGENISTQFGNVYWLAEQGYDVYLFDYRGYGKSEGLAELGPIVQDYDYMLDAVLQLLPDTEKLVVMGHSFGASLSIYGVAHSRFRDRITALVSVAAFADYQQVTQEVLSRSWLTWALQWPVSYTIDNSYRPLDNIAQISPIPLLIMHSQQDQIIALHHAKDLYAAAQPPKVMIEMTGDHNHAFELKQNRALLLGYLQELARSNTASKVLP